LPVVGRRGDAGAAFTLAASLEFLSIYDTLYSTYLASEGEKKDKKTFVGREFTRLLGTDNI